MERGEGRPGENGFYAGTRLHIALFMAFCAELTEHTRREREGLAWFMALGWGLLL